MSFDLRLSSAHHELVERTHRFAADVIRPVAGEYDKRDRGPCDHRAPARDDAIPHDVYAAIILAARVGVSSFARLGGKRTPSWRFP